ncbi:hypothetical protein [Streptomyces sp. NPDC052107]
MPDGAASVPLCLTTGPGRAVRFTELIGNAIAASGLSRDPAGPG